MRPNRGASMSKAFGLVWAGTICMALLQSNHASAAAVLKLSSEAFARAGDLVTLRAAFNSDGAGGAAETIWTYDPTRFLHVRTDIRAVGWTCSVNPQLRQIRAKSDFESSTRLVPCEFVFAAATLPATRAETLFAVLPGKENCGPSCLSLPGTIANVTGGLNLEITGLVPTESVIGFLTPQLQDNPATTAIIEDRTVAAISVQRRDSRLGSATCTIIPSAGEVNNSRGFDAGRFRISNPTLIIQQANTQSDQSTLSCLGGIGNASAVLKCNISPTLPIPLVTDANATLTNYYFMVCPGSPPLQPDGVSTGNLSANGVNTQPSLSNGGTRVVFESTAGGSSIFVSEKVNGLIQTSPVNRDAQGAALPGVNGESAISPDGQVVVFTNGAGLTAPDNGRVKIANGNIYMATSSDSRLWKGIVISRAPNGAPANGSSNNPVVSGDQIIYESLATNLTADPITGGAELYAYNMRTGVTRRINTNPATGLSVPKANNCSSARSSAADNGVVVFEDRCGAEPAQIYASFNGPLAKGKRLISRSSTAGLGNGSSSNPSLSQDGSYLFFDSEASNLVSGDTNGKKDIFRVKLKLLSGDVLADGPIERVSVNVNGIQANGVSERPLTCTGGRYVSFESDATNLAENRIVSGSLIPPTLVRNVLAKDIVTGLVVKYSRNASSGSDVGANSLDASLSPDCRAIAFATNSADISTGASDQRSQIVSGLSLLNVNITGHWAKPSENGWGLTISQQGDALFPNWFTYGSDGKPLWLSLAAGAVIQADGSYRGAVYDFTGIPFNQINGRQAFSAFNIVGDAKITAVTPQKIRFDYTVNNISQSKDLDLLVFGEPTDCASAGNAASDSLNYTDVWSNVAESGWGVHLTHQKDVIFGVWYTFNSAGRNQWITAITRAPAGGTTYTGPLFRPSSGVPFNQINNAAAASSIPEVGSVSFSFTDATNMRMNYTLDGITQSKALVRYQFGSTATRCKRSGS